MILSHAKLIRADPADSGLVTHHANPRNGMVHNGHPKDCPTAECRAWAALLVPDPEREQINRINALLDEQTQDAERGTMTLVVWVAVLGAIALAGGLFWMGLR